MPSRSPGLLGHCETGPWDTLWRRNPECGGVFRKVLEDGFGFFKKNFLKNFSNQTNQLCVVTHLKGKDTPRRGRRKGEAADCTQGCVAPSRVAL